MVIITILYVVGAITTALICLLMPIIQKKQRERAVTILLKKYNLVFSGNVTLYLERQKDANVGKGDSVIQSCPPTFVIKLPSQPVQVTETAGEVLEDALLRESSSKPPLEFPENDHVPFTIEGSTEGSTTTTYGLLI
eukprot:GDKJ01046293.1.p1 GENE.GDKJ01046293.1~~GDKJ01046293.1.p1  ORF type:complete len:137 (-),score=4.59 GDKJ01046293.1:283-693(-)